MIDLVVAGGGPVGLATAIDAAMADLEVVVVEPRPGAIDKACGEGLMPQALARLNTLGIDPQGVDLTGIRYLSGARAAQATFSAGPGRGVRRTTLHEAMLDRARQVGVRIHPGAVSGVTQTAAGVHVAGMDARYLVGADGLHSTVRRATGLAARPAGARRFGLRQHFRVAPWSDLVEVHWLPGQEVYVTPVSPDTVGVAVLGPRPLDLAAAIASLPSLADHLSGAAQASALRGAGPLRQSSTARVAGRVLLVGDAAGYVDALTGEGLRVGFAEAQAAVEAIVTDQPQRYEAAWTRITRSYRNLTNTLLWVGARPRLRPMIVPTAQALPRTFTRIVDRIAG
ncbi:MAG: NAD(P)/FAD-dependent oxidoreductase [Candidatus Nanopelagicales bacterium]